MVTPNNVEGSPEPSKSPGAPDELSPGTAVATPSASTSTAPRKRKAVKSRGIAGGIQIGFTPEELKAQAAKRKAWMRGEVVERIALRKKVQADDAKSSDSALRIVLMFWFMVILAIGYHVYQTIQRGLDQVVDESEYDIPASEGLLKAFREQKTM